MTTADQIVERDGQVNVGGEWLDLHADDAARSMVWFAPVGTAAPTLAGLEWSPLGYVSEDGIGQPPDILDRIDDALNSYDAQRSTGEPWPFESF